MPSGEKIRNFCQLPFNIRLVFVRRVGRDGRTDNFVFCLPCLVLLVRRYTEIAYIPATLKES